ncbi:UPAR/Ly6 domain-containing protein bou [Plodia interpunctella]|uniref:UPAR/Ly6 domain-containing protein bou n=1 Tax=Plodia interpunctella TaxID=58824 RepID=UPI0023688E91|nr:uncharacterized protein LOC128671125 [Plodia interpunctella]
MRSSYILVLHVIVTLSTLKFVDSINCYQCSGSDSDNPFECNEFLDSNTELMPVNCSNIPDAQYCIKHVGRNGGLAIDCYQCNSSSTMECGDGLMNLDGGVLTPTSCEHVHNAQYCIKLTGGISTVRYCSSLDLGTYCNYVQQVGDKLEYRTCIYTCSSDGCNAASTLGVPLFLIGLAALGHIRI